MTFWYTLVRLKQLNQFAKTLAEVYKGPQLEAGILIAKETQEIARRPMKIMSLGITESCNEINDEPMFYKTAGRFLFTCYRI